MLDQSPRVRAPRTSLIVALALAAVGCSGGGTVQPATPAVSQAPSPAISSPAATAGPTTPAATPGNTAPTPATRVEVSLTDSFEIQLSSSIVAAGAPVTFVVTNVGVIDHEFFLGDEQAQQAHAAEMESMGGMMHDHPNGVGVAPGQTKELTVVFDAPGSTIAGCHVPGHYAAGMRAEITIQ